MHIRRPFLQRIEGRAWLYAFGVIFRVALELAYKDFVVPWYSGSGFTLVDNPDKYIESWVLYIGFLLLLPPRARRPSDFLVSLTFFVYLAPLLVFYGFAAPTTWALYCVLAQYAIMSFVRMGKPVRIPAVKNGPAMALGVAILGVLVASTWMVTSGGLANFNLNLSAVYDFREEATETLNVGLMSYIVTWVPAVCGPLLLMRALRDGNRVLALGVVALHVFWFGVTSHKSVLFFPLLVVFLHSLFKRSRALSLIPVGTSFVVLVSLVSYYATESLFLSGLFVRRVFFTSSQLTFTYYEFFDLNPHVFWSNSVLSSFVPYPYDESVALIIGDYLNQPNAWANNSFFSTGYMHAGFLGVVIYGVVAGFMLKVLDSLVSVAVPMWMSLSIVIVPFFTLITSADLTTTLLTHGLGFAIFMLYLMKVPAEVRGERYGVAGESTIGHGAIRAEGGA